ncbi:NADP oxidoreductase coenzyme F420-dependent [Nitrosotalea sinensis]|jgi:NADPH-dependent F420 reductase|uniref:NADP oxidoreductase coenzyme F420-dependent n=1 Tax=Nitrosotalea sinensis TaxID=1499975 RepID=A0A2H1EE49_9ARCH|nr:NADPH-dependent F420 reductase [Candidatus Nitrosotalea sinensis]SHO42649.1 NADP oxidoreductase coenzyme F420-dependent [Candidatus Nitrosotalea sinensis]
MKIGIIGGTGGMGKGFALRWCENHDILIGSRESSKAEEAAREYTSLAQKEYSTFKGTITGKDNITVAKESDVLVLSIPYENIDAICSQLLPNVKDSCTVISPIVPLTKTDVGFEFISFKDKKPSAFELVHNHMKNKSRLVSAFHTVSEKKLVDPKLILDSDIFVCGDAEDSISITRQLITEIRNLRPILLGPGSLSYLAEVATPILLNAMIKNKMKNPGIKII